jgi:predicted DNA binding CopG/RHH family protein
MMAKPNKTQEAVVAARLEGDLADDDAWEDDLAEVDEGKPTLGAVISIRLNAGQAERLRAIASSRGLGYTTLVRNWVEERLLGETATLPFIRPQITMSGEALTSADEIQISGWGLVRHGDAEEQSTEQSVA